MSVVIPTNDAAPAVDWVPITLSGGNLDLTDPAGPTGGQLARSLFVETGGVIKFDTLGGLGRAPTVASGTYVSAWVKKIYSSSGGTTATGVWALL